MTASDIYILQDLVDKVIFQVQQRLEHYDVVHVQVMVTGLMIGYKNF